MERDSSKVCWDKLGVGHCVCTSTGQWATSHLTTGRALRGVEEELAGDSILPQMSQLAIKTWHRYCVYIIDKFITCWEKNLFFNCMTNYSICQFSWCKYSFSGLFQYTNLRSLDTELGRDVHSQLHPPLPWPHPLLPISTQGLWICSNGIFHPELIICDTHPKEVRILML